MEYSNIGFWNTQIGAWADFKSFYESGSALRGPRNLKNGTWADFKSFSPISSSVAKFAIKTYLGRGARPYYIDLSKFQPNLSDQSFIFQLSVRKLDFSARSGFWEFQGGGRRRRRRRLMTTGSLARCLPLTHPGVTYPVRGYPSLRFLICFLLGEAAGRRRRSF